MTNKWRWRYDGKCAVKDDMTPVYEQVMGMILGNAESLMSYDTYQFENYSKVAADGLDEEKKA